MSLAGLTVLLVEDEPVIGIALEDLFADAGAKPVLAGSLAEARRMAEEFEFDAALLDVNVCGEISYPLAELLSKRGVPVVFATGQGAPTHGNDLACTPTIMKPYDFPEIEEAIMRVRSNPNREKLATGSSPSAETA